MFASPLAIFIAGVQALFTGLSPAIGHHVRTGGFLPVLVTDCSSKRGDLSGPRSVPDCSSEAPYADILISADARSFHSDHHCGLLPDSRLFAALPGEQARSDATRVVFDIQRQAGIDLSSDGELYRFDVSQPDTNGMIDYFVRPMGGVRSVVGRSDHEAFHRQAHMKFRRKTAGVVEGPLGEGGLNLVADCKLAAGVAAGPFKFTVTSPYMLARTFLDRHYGDFNDLVMAVAAVLAEQVAGLPCSCLQIDEANIPGNPDDGAIAAAAINVCWRRSKVAKPYISVSATMADRAFSTVPGKLCSTSSTRFR